MWGLDKLLFLCVSGVDCKNVIMLNCFVVSVLQDGGAQIFFTIFVLHVFVLLIPDLHNSFSETTLKECKNRWVDS